MALEVNGIMALNLMTYSRSRFTGMIRVLSVVGSAVGRLQLTRYSGATWA